MATFTLNNKVQSKNTAGSKVAPAPQVSVGQGILRQVFPNGAGGEAHANQMQITIHTGPNIHPTYRGAVSFKVGADKYTLNKGDSHALWYSHQTSETEIAQFEALFLKLANNGNKPIAITEVTKADEEISA